MNDNEVSAGMFSNARLEQAILAGDTLAIIALAYWSIKSVNELREELAALKQNNKSLKKDVVVLSSQVSSHKESLSALQSSPITRDQLDKLTMRVNRLQAAVDKINAPKEKDKKHKNKGGKKQIYESSNSDEELESISDSDVFSNL